MKTSPAMKCALAAVPLISLVVALLLLEIAVRLVVPRARWQAWDMGGDMAADRELGWVYKPNLDRESWGAEGAVRFRTNPDGVLPHTVTPDAAHVAVLLVGDSTVIGRHVPEGHRLHDRLSERLPEIEGQTVTVVNAAVEGYSTDQSLIRLERLLKRYRPRTVIYGFCLNDIGPNQAPAVWGVPKAHYQLTRESLTKRIPPADPKPLVFGARGWRRWARKSAIYQIVKNPVKRLLVKRTQQSSQGVTDYYDKFYFGEKDWMAPHTWKLFVALVNQMKAISDAYGAKFIVYAHPDAMATWEPYRRQIASDEELKRFDAGRAERTLTRLFGDDVVCPVLHEFLDAPDRGPFHLLPMDAHANSRGYETIANALYRCLNRN